MQHIRCLLQFSTMRMQHMFHRCGLVRDKLAEGEDNEEWTPKRLMGNTGILGSLFLRHHWYVMLLPQKISADKEEKSTNDEEQSKRGSWSTTTKLLTDEIAPLHAKPEIKIVRTSWMTRDQLTNLEAMMAIDLSSEKWKVQAGPVDPQAKISSISSPDNDWEVLEWPPWVHFAEEHKAQAAADVFMAGPWRYFCQKYNTENDV
jgi:hypothetical protein